MFLTSKLNLIIVLFIAILISGCGSDPVSPVDKRELTTLEKAVVQADNDFGFRLLKEINATQRDSNIFISPLSVSMALGMTLNGAGGTTRDDMAGTLGFVNMSDEDINQTYRSLIDLLVQLDPKVDFRIGNSIWYDQGMIFEQTFLDANRTYFDAEVEGLDFDNSQSVNVINKWVDRSTNGKIKSIIDSIDPNAVMFLINAIYFKGDWTVKFKAEDTVDDVFNLPNGSHQPVKLMNRSDTISYLENDAFQAVDLPYGDDTFSMTVLLPKNSAALDALVDQLSPESLAIWNEQFAEQHVALSLPKFKLEYESSLNDVLKAMGMSVAFEPYEADFSRMYQGPESLYISEVRHKTFVDVNEKGTEAAAVTSVEVEVTSLPQFITMRVDRPFLFFIQEHHSGTILFIGKILAPNS